MNHLNYLIKQIISYEPSTDDKLSMLTEIGLMTKNDQIFKATEEVRDELASSEKIQKVRTNTLRNHESDDHISNFLL
jgi:primase-polymerase (primpol)-like protein